jgi:hypothetical protein
MLLMGCEEGSDPAVAESSGDPSQVSAAADCNADFCEDFSDGTDAKRAPHGGFWEVIDNEYVGTGGRTRMDQSVINGGVSAFDNVQVDVLI